jgi:Flp pilus assembly protein TadD
MSGTGATANATARVGRNDPCPCGSGRKYKHCCQAEEAGGGSVVTKARPSPPPKAKAQALVTTAKRHWAAGRRAEAIRAFREIVRLYPGDADALHDLGQLYYRSGRLSEAGACFERAVRLRPGFDAALRPLAYVLEQLGRRHDACAAYRRLSRMSGDVLERRLMLAKALVLEGELDEAEKELRRVTGVAPHNPYANVLLGNVLLERGRFEEAARHLTQAVEVFPDALKSLGLAKRMTEADRPLMERVQGQAEREDLGPEPRANIHFGLGKAFDDLGDYALAMRHYEAGNRLKAATGRFDRAGLIAHNHSVMTDFSAEALERAGRSAERPLHPEDELPVFIVGMPRSGTTLVEQILSAHPAVASGGELTFWGDRVRQWLSSADNPCAGAGSPARFGPIRPERLSLAASGEPSFESGGGDWRPMRFSQIEPAALARAADDYLVCLRAIGPKALRVTDKSPTNFARLGPIRLALPAARVIHCRRHPVDNCLSIFFTPYNGRDAWNRANLVFQYRQYERLMDHWRRVLPADRFTEVDYETLIADREPETRRLVAFCGLDWSEACLAPERNGRAVRTASVWQAR